MRSELKKEIMHIVMPKRVMCIRALAICLLTMCWLFKADAQTDSTSNSVDTSGYITYKVDPLKKKPASKQTTSANSTQLLPPHGGGCTITGPSSVTAGTLYSYFITCDNGMAVDEWMVNCGTGVNYYTDQIDLQWSGSCTSGSVKAYAVDGTLMASKTVTITSSALTGGSISNTTQTIPYNTTPTQITASAASGGSCSGSYIYQWQKSSTLTGTYTDISGATSQNYQPPALTATTYYKRKVTCSTSIAYTSNTATVTVGTMLIAGYVTNPNQTINMNTVPAQINAVAASGGSCGGVYAYQWQSSTDGINYTNITGASGQNYQPGALTQTTYFRRMTTCNGEVGYTETNAKITVIRPLDGGCLVNGNQTIASGNIPATVTTTPAKDGNCSGNYQYQWQSSVDNVYFTNIPGATAQNLNFTAPITKTTYYQRKVTCGSEVVYKCLVIVTVN